MGLLDDLFKKDTISQLKKQIIEKTAALVHAESRIVEASVALTELQNQLAETKSALSEREDGIQILETELDKKQSDNSQQSVQIETLKIKALEKNEQAEQTIVSLQALIANAEAKALAATTDLDSIAKDWHEARKSLDAKDHAYQQREERLEEMSEKLRNERQRFQQQTAELRARETRVSDWDKSLTNLKVDLEVRSEALNSQRLEQESRAYKLEDWARDLSVFQSRVNQLDAEAQRLAEHKKKIQSSDEMNRLNLEREQATLRRLEKDVDQRQSRIESREKDITREESRIAQIKDKNLELRKEQKRLESQIESLEELNRDYLSENKRLTKKYERLQTNVEMIQKKLKNSTVSSNLISSLTNSKVLSWLLEDGGPSVAEIENGWLGISGSGPWHDQVLESVLDGLGYGLYHMPDDDLEYVVVGRKDWLKTDLLAQIDARKDQPLRIYSQEMFFAKLVTGKDPFDSNDNELLEEFAADHPALQFLMSLPEPWPTVTDGDPEYIIEIDGEDFGVSESPLHILGYRVGTTSDLSVAKRREILTKCFESRKLTFSEDSNDAYISKWGRGGGAQRLYRMAVHIKSLADGRVGKDYRKPQARLDWVSDLKWLKEHYFVNYKARFEWPGV
jgi:hypothetical protein